MTSDVLRRERNAEKLKWHEAVLADPNLPSNSKILAGWLMHRFTSALEICISEDTISHDLNWSPSTTKRAVSALKKCWVSVGRRGLCNLYRMRSDRVALIAERLAANRDVRKRERIESENRSFENWSHPEVISDLSTVPAMTPIPSIDPSIIPFKMGLPSEVVGDERIFDGSGRWFVPMASRVPLSAVPIEADARRALTELLLGLTEDLAEQDVEQALGPQRFSSLVALLQRGQLFPQQLHAAMSTTGGNIGEGGIKKNRGQPDERLTKQCGAVR